MTQATYNGWRRARGLPTRDVYDMADEEDPRLSAGRTKQDLEKAPAYQGMKGKVKAD